jgi:hypothetical protein
MQALEEQLKTMRVSLAAAEAKIAELKAAEAQPPKHTAAYTELAAFFEDHDKKMTLYTKLVAEHAIIVNNLEETLRLAHLYASEEEFSRKVTRLERARLSYKQLIARHTKNMEATRDEVLRRADANFESE